MDEELLGHESGMGTDRVRASAFHQAPVYLMTSFGPDHLITSVNEAFVTLLMGGFNPQGMRLADVMAGAADQGMIDFLDRGYRGERVSGQRWRFAVVAPDGHEREVFLDFDVVPWRGADGEIIGTVAVSHDITALVRREQADARSTADLAQRFRRATDVIEEVQRALLPSRLPVLPGVDVAASYVVGGAEQAAGGDWFEVVRRPGGALAVVVGDVVGHGVAASAVMAQLRAVTLERLHAGVSLVEVVAALDRFVAVAPGGRSATVCLVELDPATGVFTYCSAGHPPPLVVDAGSGTGEGSRYLDPSGQGPVGTEVDRRAGTGVLTTGQVLLLYSDGVLERPGVGAPVGTLELLQVATDAVHDRLMPAFSAATAVDRATTQTLERLTRDSGSNDDITLLALQRAPFQHPLHLETGLSSAAVADVRAGVRRWFRVDQVDPGALVELDQVLTELCDNVVEHAYDGAGGPVVVDLHLGDDGTLTLAVSDRGRWRTPVEASASGRGLGLAVVQQLAERVTIDHADDGTRVTVQLVPWKQSQGAVARVPQVPAQMFDVYLDLSIDEAAPATLRVQGAVDAGALDELTSQLALCTTPGRPDLVVDLDDVTVLSSAAIHVLRRSLERAHAAGVTATVSGRPGSVAHHVMSLAGIPVGPAS